MPIEAAKHQCACGQSFMSALAKRGHEAWCSADEMEQPNRCNMCHEVYDMAHWDACPRCDPEVDL